MTRFTAGGWHGLSACREPKLLNSRYTDVWIKGMKGWQMVVWQSTSIPAPSP
jgi:hypothetical protein